MDDMERRILEMAGRDYRYGGSREQAIRDELDMSATLFWLRLHRLVENPPAELAVEFGPTLNRLKRLQRSRQAQRSPRRAG